MSSGIIETIKKVALNAFEASNPVKLLFGTVTSVNPVKIKVGDILTLTKEFLVINGAVEVGDTVTLIRVQGGQKYVVLGTRTEYVEHTVYLGGGIVGDTVIDRAVSWALGIANNPACGYNTDRAKRWGPDFDCSSLVISAFQNAGVPVKTNGANTTYDMKRVFLKSGFIDVVGSINKWNGEGLKKGDVLLLQKHHTALVVDDEHNIVHAAGNERGGTMNGTPGDQTGKEICRRTYYNGYWDCVLRYVG